jgi:hypothetical protein
MVIDKSIRKVSDSNLGRKTGYINRDNSYYFSVRRGKFQDKKIIPVTGRESP